MGGERRRPRPTRSVTESPVPGRLVIRPLDFAAQRSTDLANRLRPVDASFNVSLQPIRDSRDHPFTACGSAAPSPPRSLSTASSEGLALDEHVGFRTPCGYGPRSASAGNHRRSDATAAA